MMSNHRADRQVSAIRVLVVDDQKMMQELMKDYVGIAEDIQVVGIASNGREGVQQILALEPDVVLMDIEMPDMDGIAATQMLKNRKSPAKVLVVSSSYDDRYLAQSLRNGAMGYLLKTTTPEELVAAIRGVHGGSLQFGSGILQQKLSSMTPGGQEAASRQTVMPKQVKATKRKATTIRFEPPHDRPSVTSRERSNARPLTSVGDGRPSQRSRSSTVTIDVDVDPNGSTRREKNAEAQTAVSLENLAIELSQIRAGYWVLRTEIQAQRRWLNNLSVALVLLVAVCGLLALFR